jgi:hypothetical protein
MELQEVARMFDERARRLKKRLAVNYSTADGALPRSGCTLDLSPGGLFLNSRTQLPEGSHVIARISLPTGGTAEIHGIVAWSRRTPHAYDATARGGMGLRLVWAEDSWFDFLAKSAQAA